MMKKFRWMIVLAAVCMLIGCSSNIKDGIMYLEEEDYEMAISCFKEEIAEEKNLGDAYRGMGIALYELERYQEAIDSFESALGNNEEPTATLYALMATCYLQVDEYESALDYYKKALEMEDCTEELGQEILFNEIAIYQKTGDWEILKKKVTAYMEAYPDDNRMDKTAEFLKTR